MYGSGGLNMTKTVKRNRNMLTSKRNGFRKKSNQSVYTKDTLVMSFKTKKVSKAKTQDAIEKIQWQAKKDRDKLIFIYVVVFTIIVALFIWIMF